MGIINFFKNAFKDMKESTKAQHEVDNIFLYGASVNANLSSGIGSLLICTLVSVAWAVIYNVAGTRLLNKCDIY